MYEMIEKKKNDISVYGVKYGDLQIDDISADKDRVKKFVNDINKYQLSLFTWVMLLRILWRVCKFDYSKIMWYNGGKCNWRD